MYGFGNILRVGFCWNLATRKSTLQLLFVFIFIKIEMSLLSDYYIEIELYALYRNMHVYKVHTHQHMYI